MTAITILATKCYCSLLLSYLFFQMLSTCAGLDPVIFITGNLVVKISGQSHDIIARDIPSTQAAD